MEQMLKQFQGMGDGDMERMMQQMQGGGGGGGGGMGGMGGGGNLRGLNRRFSRYRSVSPYLNLSPVAVSIRRTMERHPEPDMSEHAGVLDRRAEALPWTDYSWWVV